MRLSGALGLVMLGMAALGMPKGAWAAESGDTGDKNPWDGGSIVAARVLGTGHDAVHLQGGWPGVGIEYLHGTTPWLDTGMSLTYSLGSFEGRPVKTQAGPKLTARFRFRLLEAGAFTLGAGFDPGLFVYIAGPAGVAFNLSLLAGVRIMDTLQVAVGVEAPLFMSFLNGVQFARVLGSVGVEFRLTSSLSLTLRGRVGPLYNVTTGGSDLSYDALAGLALRL